MERRHARKQGMGKGAEFIIGAIATVVIFVAIYMAVSYITANGYQASGAYRGITLTTAYTTIFYTTMPPTTSVSTTTISPYSVDVVGNQQYQNYYITNYSTVQIFGNSSTLAFYLLNNSTAIFNVYGSYNKIKISEGSIYLNVPGNSNQFNVINSTIINKTESGSNNRILSG